MILKFNNTKKSWEVSEEGVLSIFHFLFVDEKSDVINFDNLSFGVSLIDKDGNRFEESFPQNGVLYVKTDQEKVESFSISAEKFYPGKQYDVIVWCENAGKRYEKSLNIDPKTYVEQNFPSWIWDEKIAMWEPPIGYPVSDVFMKWDEKTISWVEAPDFVVEEPE